MTDTLADYLTTEQVADALGITTGRVRQLARKHDFGTMVGRGRLYSPGDVEAMRARKTERGPVATGRHSRSRKRHAILDTPT